MKDWLTLFAERAQKKHEKKKEKKKSKDDKLLEEAVKRNQKNVASAWYRYFNR